MQPEEPQKMLIPDSFERLRRAVEGYSDGDANWHDGLLQKMEDVRLLQRATLAVALAALLKLSWPDIVKGIMGSIASAHPLH